MEILSNILHKSVAWNMSIEIFNIFGNIYLINYNKMYGISVRSTQSSCKGLIIIRNGVPQHLKGRKEKDLLGVFQVVGGKLGLHGEIFPRKRQDQLYQMF